MRVWILLLAGAFTVSAAEDPWSKVAKIKSGAEIRIVRDGVRQPILGKFDEARDESLVLVVRNEQVAIPKAEIERVDARPSTAGRVKAESKTTQTDPDATKPPTGPAPAGARQGTSTSSGLSIGSKLDFEVVYRRAPRRKQP